MIQDLLSEDTLLDTSEDSNPPIEPKKDVKTKQQTSKCTDGNTLQEVQVKQEESPNSSSGFIRIEDSPLINVQYKSVITLPDIKWRLNSSDSSWKTISDTSIMSTPSSSGSPKKVSKELLEVCDGMDDASLTSASPASCVDYITVRGRGQSRKRGGHTSQPNARTKKQRRIARDITKGKHKAKKSPSNSSADSSSDSPYNQEAEKCRSDSTSKQERKTSTSSSKSSSDISCSWTSVSSEIKDETSTSHSGYSSDEAPKLNAKIKAPRTVVDEPECARRHSSDNDTSPL